MKFVRFEGQEGPKYGIVEGNEVKEILGGPFDGYQLGTLTYRLSDLKILSPCQPSKVIGVGLNYRDHIISIGKEIPEEPLLFIKPSTAVIGHNDEIVLPRESEKVGFEAELAVVIGKHAKDVRVEDALDYILGYTCLNDVSARDIQRKEQQWTRAKSFDTFCPMGPFLVTGIDPTELAIKSYLNGELCQSSTTAQLVFNVPKLVSFISRSMSILPGDIIATGTPGKTGLLKPEDVIEVEVEGIGRLRNRVVAL